MAAELFITPSPALDSNANPYSGAKWYFYATGSSTPQNVYADAALANSLGSVVTADSAGRFPAIFLDTSKVYRGVLKNSSGTVTLEDLDPVGGAASQLGAYLASSAGAGAVGLPSGGAVDDAIRYVTPQMKDATADGIADDRAAFLAADALGLTVRVPAGSYKIASNTTLTSPLQFEDGAQIVVPTGVTLTIKSEIASDGSEIFSGAGTVNLDGSPSGYNLAWFTTTNGYINERFDFAKRGMTSFNNKIIRIPHPYAGQAGSQTTSVRTVWLYNGPIVFLDAQNTSKVYVEGEFLAAGNCAAFMEFGDAAKPESIFFYGAIQAQALSTQTVGVGIDIKACARVQFFCNIVLNGFQTPMRIGSEDMVASVTDVYAPMMQLSFFYETGLKIYGQSASFTCQGIKLGQVNVTAAQATGLNAIEIGGLVRAVTIDEAFYATDTAKDGYTANDAENVVEIASDDTNLLAAHIKIGGIYQANATNGLKITSKAGSPTQNNIEHVVVERIWGKFNGSAANIDYCRNVTIRNVENSSDVTIGSNTSYCAVDSPNAGMRTITDNGSYTLINGLGKQTRGGGTPPAPSVNWPIGALIRETGDNRVYLRIAKAGTASDFLMVRGALRGTTASRPTLTTTDTGQLYLDNTLNANGKPIWWNGAAWVDATGATV